MFGEGTETSPHLIMKYQPCGKWNQGLPFNKRLSDLVGARGQKA
jgi:hypothetical protein